ncbi:MAG: hypothetical protein AAF889_11255 [Cyanobacteria bacterium P01_D01_bin.73]
MSRTLTIPVSRAMRHKTDVWELAIEIGQKKGLSPQQVVTAVFRSHARQWAGLDSSRPHLHALPAIASPTLSSKPFNAADALDALIDSI